MSWCLSEPAALNCSPDFNQRSVPRTFFAPTNALFRTSVASPCGVCTRGSLLVSMKVSVCVICLCLDLCLNPDSAFDAVPDEIFRGPVQDGRHEPVWRLKFEVKERRFGGAQAMLRFGRNEYQVTGADLANALLGFDGPVAFHDEVEVLAVLMQVIRGGGSLLVVHDAGQHVVDLSQFLVNEEGPFAARYGRHQLRQLVFVKYVCHVLFLKMLLRQVCIEDELHPQWEQALR